MVFAGLLAGGILFIIWFFASLYIVNEKHMGVRVFLGRPLRFVDSGIHFAPFPFWKIALFPKRQFRCTYNVSVRSMRGFHGGGGEEYAAVDMVIPVTLYYSYPRDDGLKKALENMPIAPRAADAEQQLTSFFEGAVVNACRAVYGKRTWREADETSEDLKGEIEAILRSEDGPFKKAGSRDEDIYIAIGKPELPERLRESLPLPDIRRLEEQSADEEAHTKAIKTVGTLVRMIAEATGMSPAEVRKNIAGNSELRKEFQNLGYDLLTRSMSLDEKRLVDFRVSGAEGMEKFLLNAIAAMKLLPLDAGQKEEDGGEKREQCDICDPRPPRHRYRQKKLQHEEEEEEEE